MTEPDDQMNWDKANQLGENICQAFDGEEPWATNYGPHIRQILLIALDMADTPPRLRDAIELLIWKDTKDPPITLSPWRDLRTVGVAALFEAGHPAHPKRPSTAKQTDVAHEAGVSVRTIRRWQNDPKYRPKYRRLVALFREGKNRP